MEYIDLNRHFSSPKKDEDEYSYLEYLGASQTSWDELLQYECVVILGGAGSGKTEEFLHRSEILKASGEFAVFFAIEELAGNSLEDCLSLEDERNFDNWQSSGEIGYFFLDAVDEAKLKSKNDFIRALRKLSKKLGDHVNRSRIYISCRPSDWDHKTDIKIIEKFFVPETSFDQVLQDYSHSEADRRKLLLEPILQDDEEKASDASEEQKIRKINAFKLAPLSADQLETFIKQQLEGNHAEFLSDLQEQGLEEYTKHPGDLIQLTEYWSAHGKFSSLTEMTDHFIRKQLTDKSHREDGNLISDVEAWDGAKRLALALVLGKKLTIKTSQLEESIENKQTESNHINPELVLDDWTPAKRETLLRRPIFSPASYGRVRFKHRKMIEYLAAKAFSTILNGHEGRQKAFPVLFKQEFDVDTIPKELRSITAWLAQWHDDVLQKVIQFEPMVLVRFGDAKSLGLSTRKKLLTELSKLHSKGDVAYERSEESSAIWAFSDSGLEAEIRIAWNANPFWQFRYMLLQMISSSKITGLGDLAESVIFPSDDDFSLSVTGADTLIALDDETRLNKVARELIATPTLFPEKKHATLSSLLYPKYLTTSEVIKLIERAHTPKRYSGDGFSYVISKFLKSCPENEIENLLTGISELALRKPYDQDYRPISKQFGYLARQFENLAHKALDRIQPSETSNGLADILVAMERSDGSSTLKKHPISINDRLTSRSNQKAMFFLADIEHTRRTEKKRDLDKRPWCRIPHHWMWKIKIEDFQWIKNIISDNSRSTYEQDTAYCFWLDQIQRQDCLNKKVEELKSLATTELRKKWLQNALQPKKKQDWEKRQEASRKKRQERQKVRRAKSGASWVDFDRKIQKSLPVADYSTGVNDANWYLLDNLSRWLSFRVRKHKTEAPRFWQRLIPAYGDKIANLYFEHIKALWRNTPHKRTVWRDNKGTTCLLSSYAFSAVGAEADADPNWASKLSNDEAKRACEHLVKAGEGRTDWMDDLLEHHSQTLLPMLRAELKRVWTSPNEYPSSWLSYCTRDIDSLPSEIQDLGKSVFVHNKPGTLRKWDDGLRLLKQVNLTSTQLSKFKNNAEQLSHDSRDQLGGRVRYLCSLFIQDFDLGLVELERQLKKSKPKERETIFGSLFDSRHSGLIPDVLTSANSASLEKAIKLAFKYIKRKDDIEHEGTYSPGRRDHAESARSALVEALLSQKSQSAYLAIRRLANDKSVTMSQHWYNVLSKGMVENSASLDGWSETEVNSFLKGADAPAKNQKEFFEQVISVIEGILYDLRVSDGTSRKLLFNAEIEDDVRDWLLEKLKDRADSRYHAFKEPEVDDKKIPDIVMASMSVPVQCALELKHSDQPHCGGINKMKKSIQTQLVDKYLKPTDRRAGLFIVSHHSKRKYWIHPSTNKRMKFEEVIKHLNDYAKKLQSTNSSQIYLGVLGIDYNK